MLKLTTDSIHPNPCSNTLCWDWRVWPSRPHRALPCESSMARPRGTEVGSVACGSCHTTHRNWQQRQMAATKPEPRGVSGSELRAARQLLQSTTHFCNKAIHWECLGFGALSLLTEAEMAVPSAK